MKIYQTSGFFKKVFGAVRAGQLNDAINYRNEDREVHIETNDLEKAEIEKLLHAARRLTPPDAKLIRKIEGFLKFAKDMTNSPVVRLERLEAALREFIGKSKHKYLFQAESDGFFLPWFVRRIVYHESCRDDPAKVQIHLNAQCHERDEEKTLTYTSADLHGGKRVSDVLAEKGFYIETDDHYLAWEKDIELFNTLYPQTGKQFHASGVAFGGSWGLHKTEMERDGYPARVVMDYFGDTVDDDGDASNQIVAKAHVVDASFWDGKDSENESAVECPIHPYVQVFDFVNHDHLLIHSRLLKPYVYRDDLMDKLVLPSDVKELISILMESAESVMEDIIRGKTGGVVVAATGEPGTGKTLTAEVCAEHLKRPLYTVQCSQLGTNEVKLEGKLKLVLTRASRWGAIFLLDEADVYVRARGDDLQQNAIVGVFLRVLEYYRGILFLTSNRETLIDDAIMSRCLAHVRYEKPKEDALLEIWRILAENYGVKFKSADLAKLVEQFPGISGRNVKNLLKLAVAVARKQQAIVTVRTIKDVSKFVLTQS